MLIFNGGSDIDRQVSCWLIQGTYDPNKFDTDDIDSETLLSTTSMPTPNPTRSPTDKPTNEPTGNPTPRPTHRRTSYA